MRLMGKEQISMGKKTSFICSQVDSFTGTKKPAGIQFPVHE